MQWNLRNVGYVISICITSCKRFGCKNKLVWHHDFPSNNSFITPWKIYSLHLLKAFKKTRYFFICFLILLEKHLKDNFPFNQSQLTKIAKLWYAKSWMYFTAFNMRRIESYGTYAFMSNETKYLSQHHLIDCQKLSAHGQYHEHYQ